MPNVNVEKFGNTDPSKAPNLIDKLVRQGGPRVSGEKLSLLRQSVRICWSEDGRTHPYHLLCQFYEREIELPFKSVVIQYGTLLILVSDNHQSLRISTFGWSNGRGWYIFKDAYLDKNAVMVSELNPGLVKYSDDPGLVIAIVLDTIYRLNLKSTRLKRFQGNPVSGRKIAFPSDSYHVLTVSSEVPAPSAGTARQPVEHRSPREHLRRGHYRRLASGREVWINSMTIGAGSSSGKVSKDYVLA